MNWYARESGDAGQPAKEPWHVRCSMARHCMQEVTLTLIGNDLGTLDGVHQYFQRAGARVRSTRWLEAAQAFAAGSATVILFADHYSRDLVLRAVTELRVSTLIIVTTEVGFFSASRTADSSAKRIIVLRSPVWGWMLLDAVRAGMGSPGES